MTIWARVLLGLAIFACVFFAGWKVSSWRAGASQAAEYESQLERMVEQVAERDRQMAQALDRLSSFDAETQQRSRATMEAVSGVARSLGETRDAIVVTDMGRAGLTADADRLRLEAYRAATASILAPSGDPAGRADEGSAPASADPSGGSSAGRTGPDPEQGIR